MGSFLLLAIISALSVSPTGRVSPERDDLVRIRDPKSVVSGKRLVADDYQAHFVVLRIQETFRPDGTWRFSHNSVGPEVIDGSWTQNKRDEICVSYDAKSKCRALYKSDKNPGFVFIQPLVGAERGSRVRMRIDRPIN